MFKKLSLILIGVVICSLALSGVALAQEDAPPRHEAGGRHRGGGEVIAIGSDNFTVRGPRGEEHVVYVDANTTFMDKDGQALSFSDLKVGDRVIGRVTRHDDGKLYAENVRVLPPPTHYQGVGVVSVVEDDEFTFTGLRGKVWEFYVDDNTEFTDRAGTEHSYSDVEVGSRVFVEAELRADGKWWAMRVGFPPVGAPLRPGGRGGPGGPGPREPHGPPPGLPEQTPQGQETL